MAVSTLTGMRLRERRLALGMRQAEVARAAGVSASYLNLIEHDRRRIGDAVLTRLATALGVSPAALRESANGTVIDDLRSAAASGGQAGPAEVDRIEEFAGRFPGWAAVLADLHRREGRLGRAVEALNDRLSHDPHLSAALHEVLQAVSSVRSTAAILAEDDDIAPDWRIRFHANLHADSERLALGAEALVGYLDQSEAAESHTLATPQEDLETWLAANKWRADAGDPGDLASTAARSLARDWRRDAVAEAASMPDDAFEAARARGLDPGALAAMFGVGILAVFRRLAFRSGSEAGLVLCDASGTLVFRKPVDGFSLPRLGAACPLWPLYTALSRPMSPVHAVVETAGRDARRFEVWAFCEPSHPAGFAGPEVREAGMLILPDPALGSPALPVGSTCRICPRTGCVARREPSIIGGPG